MTIQFSGRSCQCISLIFALCFCAVFSHLLSPQISAANSGAVGDNCADPAPVPFFPEDVSQVVLAQPGVPEEPPTPIPTPTPTPPPRDFSCSVYSFDVAETEEGENVFSGSVVSELTCLQRFVDQTPTCSPFTLPGADEPEDFVLPDYQDLLTLRRKVSSGGCGFSSSCYHLPHCDDDIAQQFKDMGSPRESSQLWNTEYAGWLDQDCNQAEAPSSPTDLCGDLHVSWASTPVSLVWKDEGRKDSGWTITSFPLELSVSGNYYLWRASSLLPLVVYDPEHTGKITSAKQLFGLWTFGGKSMASTRDIRSDASLKEPKPWSNGFEALGSLDRDHDGEVSGEELTPLGLWFDHNQDGVSQPGEVVDIADTEVTALYYEPDGKDGPRGEILASRGYQRLQNGKLETGVSVEWFSDSYSSLDEAILKLMAKSTFEHRLGISSAAKSSALQRPGVSLQTQESDQAVRLPSGFSGAWAWKLDRSDGKGWKGTAQGVLTFQENGASIKGHSLLEIPLRKNIGQADRFWLMYEFQGKKEVGANGSQVARFRIDSSDGSITETVATLSKDKKVLKGTSTVRLSKTTLGPGTLRYSWTAKRWGIE